MHDEAFTRLLHATLQKWGIGRRASRLVPVDEFRRCLQDRTADLIALESVTFEGPADSVRQAAASIDRPIDEIGVVDNRARVVAGTKTLHHLLPDLVPPMDRAWTGGFFEWTVLDPQNNQSAIFTDSFLALAMIARATRPTRLVGRGWRASATKILDNAVIGYCKLHSIRPAMAS